MRSARQGGREAWREEHASTDWGARRRGRRVARGNRPQLPQWAEREDERGRASRGHPRHVEVLTPSRWPQARTRGVSPKTRAFKSRVTCTGPPSSAGSPTSPAITVTSPQPPGPRRLEKGGNTLRDGNCPTCITQPVSGSPEIPNPKSEGGARRGEPGTSSEGKQDPDPPIGPPSEPQECSRGHVLPRPPAPAPRVDRAAPEQGPPQLPTPDLRRALHTARCGPRRDGGTLRPGRQDTEWGGARGPPHPQSRPASAPPGSPSGQLPAPGQRPSGP